MAMKRRSRNNNTTTTTNGATLVFVIFIFHCFCIRPSPSHAATYFILMRGQQLKDIDTLVSADSIFKLSFFSLDDSSNRYLGIWYDVGTVRKWKYVWIANRGDSISDSSGVLTIDSDGLLKIMYDQSNNTKSIPLSSQKAATGSNVSATLHNSGNFVLTETISNGSENRTLWQSFDYPTHTLLSGMKLGVDLKTGKNWSLTSWFSDQIPSPGAFTLEIDQNGMNQLVISRRGEVYWRSGVWNGSNFENLPELTPNQEQNQMESFYPYLNQYNYSFVSSQDERYFTYSSSSSSSILVWTMSSMGQLQVSEKIGTGINPFATLIECEKKTKGCVGNKRSACRSGEEQFTPRIGDMSGVPSNKYDENMSLSDCETECRSSCSCVAYASLYEGRGCYFWAKGSKFIEDNKSTRDVYYLPSHQGKKWWIWLIISVAIALKMSLLALSYLWWKRLKQYGETNHSTEDKAALLELGAISHKFGDDFTLFNFDSIVAATDNFSSKNKLGQGGFGPVYMGKLLEGQEIAVKRLSKSSGQGLEEFKNEIVLIAKLQHRNLVRLLGCCIKGEEKMLIYEYMRNKSLDFFLFDPKGRELLDWKKRINIMEGIAQGLLYLHKYSRLTVIHRDLKASNILLDDEMNPKISDFGLARIFEPRESEANTNRPAGTYGYMAPEYAMGGIFSVKSDVFSFGVLLLEIVSGKKNTNINNFEHHLNLIGHAWELWQKDEGVELMDPMFDTSCPKHKMLRYIHVGLLCVQESATDRPTMLGVVSMFGNEAMLLPVPKQPAFFFGRSVVETNLLEDKPENCSLNGLTISETEAR